MAPAIQLRARKISNLFFIYFLFTWDDKALYIYRAGSIDC